MKDFAYSTGLDFPVFLAAQIDIPKETITLHSYTVANSEVEVKDSVFTMGEDYTVSPQDSIVKLQLVSTLKIDFNNLKELVGEKELTPFSNIYFPVSKIGELLAPFNKMAASYSLKETGGRYLLRTNTSVIAQLCVPFPDSKFADCGLRLTRHPQLGIHVEGAEPPREMDNTHEAFQAFVQNIMPKLDAVESELTLATSAAGIVQFQLTPPREGVKVYLNSAMGYLPKREVITDADGRATARVDALFLDAGDEFDVEAGFKWYSNIARTHVKVTA